MYYRFPLETNTRLHTLMKIGSPPAGIFSHGVRFYTEKFLPANTLRLKA